jgi:hypothetical protein
VRGNIKSWLTFKLVQIAAQLDGELFMRLCEVAVMAKYLDQMDVMRLEQEHDHDQDYYNEREDYDTDSNTTRSARNTTKLH